MRRINNKTTDIIAIREESTFVGAKQVDNKLDGLV